MRRALRAAGCLLLVAILAAAGVGGWAATRLLRPFKGYAGDRVSVTVPAGRSGAAILAELERSGVIADARLARLYLVYRLGDPPLRAGEYTFAGPLTVPDVLRKLVRGEVERQALTLIEGLDLDETASAIVDAGFGPAEDVRQALHDPTPILEIDPAARDLEGYLLPETYHFARGTPPREVVRTIVGAFVVAWHGELQPALRERAEAVPAAEGAPAGAGERAGSATRASATPAPRPLPSARELVTLASIVEKEARIDAERPVIAGVYRNRLDRGIALYADPTVIYALKRLGRWDGNIRKPDLQVDSPYNTYRYAGLPPGPICSPGIASLRAAARPADVPYIYFVSRNDGSHVFATTLAEHNRNVEEWQRRYWRERRNRR